VCKCVSVNLYSKSQKDNQLIVQPCRRSPQSAPSAIQFTRFDPADYLDDEDDARLYLDACINEDLGDGTLIRAALFDIARARNMSQLAREIGISREGLYKALSDKGNPSFAIVLKLARASLPGNPLYRAQSGLNEPAK